MKIGNGGQSNVVESSGVQTTSSFNIARTPHMFNILSSGLYSDKIGAVLREVGCNAMDAHVMAGKPELPIQVKLPTGLDRSFYVKDWGPGLDDHEVRELYSTYGWSSKQQRDDVTGAFGLGSKSPFAYTMQNDEDSDGFTVESVKNGVKRIYTCYISESGAPAISRLYEGAAEPDWQNGVKVTFPVRERDIGEFHEKSREIFRWFNIKPEILGLDGGIEEPGYRMRSDFFAIPESSWSNEERACVIMGGVRYPIKRQRLRDLTKIEEGLLAAGIHLWVPMGTVMMTPSREELEYTERTRKGIKEWLERTALDVATRIREAVEANRESRWAWYKNIQEYASTLPFGISARLSDYLAAAGMDADYAKEIIQIVNEKAAVVPNWVGDGLAGPGPKFKMDPETGKRMTDTDGYPVLDDKADLRGCRVWVYQKSSARDGAVTRREVIRGHVRVSSEKTESVKLAFASNVQAYYVDGKQADARVRGAVREGEVTTALLVMPCKGTDLEFAKEYAERMCSNGQLEGLPLVPSSSLGVPYSVVEARERRKMQREQSPREFFSDTSVKYLGLNGNVVETTLGELDDSDLFYVCVRNFGLSRREHFWTGAGSDAMSFQGYYRSEVLTGFKAVVDFLQLPVNGFVLMDTEARIKRLKLPEQGFKPFLPLVREALRNPENWAKLTAGIDRTPQVKLQEMYYADDYGWLGMLGHHMVKRTEFWKAVRQTPQLRGLVAEVAAFVKKVRAKKAASVRTGVQSALMTLASKVHGLHINSSELSEQTYYEVKNEFIERRPMMAALAESTMKDWMNHQPNRAVTALVLTSTLEATAPEIPATPEAEEEPQGHTAPVALAE